MKASLGSRFIGSYVDSVALGDYEVSHMCLGDGQIFPEDDSGMRRIALEIPPEGFLEWAYWTHATEAVADLVTPARYLRAKIEGKYYYVHSSFDNSPTCQLREGTLLFSADEAPPMQSLHEGDVLEIEALIPALRDSWYMASPSTEDLTFYRPYLPGTTVDGKCEKGAKKTCASVWIYYDDPVRNIVYCHNYFVAEGHKNGERSFTLGTSNPNIVSTPEGYKEIDPTIPTFSRVVHVSCTLGRGTYHGRINLKYPEIKRTFKLKIKGIQ